MSGLTRRPLRPDANDLALVADCFSANGMVRAASALQWQYIDNVPALTIADVAVDETGEPRRLAAMYATLPARVTLARAPRLAVQSLDTLTDANFRGQGLFASLARSTFDRAAGAGAAFIYGFPNGSSGPGFFGKLGWKNLDPVPFLIRPLRSRYVLDRLRLGRVTPSALNVPLAGATRPRLDSRWTLVTVDRFDERVTELWSRFSASVGVAVRRDAAYLNWRLVDKPEETYQRLALFERDALLGFVAFALKSKHGGRVGYVLELMFQPGRADVGRALLRTALADLTREGADVVLAWSFPHSPSYATFLRGGLVPFPTRLRPIELHFGARAFDSQVAALVEKRSSWYLSYLDSDTV